MTNLDFIHRLMQCITCGHDPKTCGCTEEDEDSEGMCLYWVSDEDE